jgi:uncharacterized membrane protein YeaQ/YmgE (transglycosylase-associated protein family)
MQLLFFLIIGGIAGWLAGMILKGRGLGLIGNVIVGVLGALLGGWLLKMLGISIGGGLIGSFITSILGSIVCLLLVGIIKRT